MFDEGEQQGWRTGNAPEALDQQPAEAHDRDSKSSCGSLSSSKYWLSAVLGGARVRHQLSGEAC